MSDKIFYLKKIIKFSEILLLRKFHYENFHHDMLSYLSILLLISVSNSIKFYYYFT